jgi:hypothetical protein
MVGFSTAHTDGSAELRLMHRDQLIDRIRTRNPGATLEFLNRFRDEALRLYLRHLACADEPRGSVWVRPGDTVGILGRESAE